MKWQFIIILVQLFLAQVRSESGKQTLSTQLHLYGDVK